MEPRLINLKKRTGAVPAIDYGVGPNHNYMACHC